MADSGQLLHARDAYQEAKRLIDKLDESPGRAIPPEEDDLDALRETCEQNIDAIKKGIIDPQGTTAPIQSTPGCEGTDAIIPSALNDSGIGTALESDGDVTDTPAVKEEDPVCATASVTFENIEKGQKIGGMQGGTVYEATVSSGESRRRIALKEPRFEAQLQNEIDETKIDTDGFLDEIAKWEQVVDHPYIVDILAWDEEPRPWVAMEYMDEEHLGVYRLRHDLAVDEILWIGECLADALAHAHDRDIVHTDIKPRNILLTSTTDAPWSVPKIADWGLARFLREHSGSQKDFTAKWTIQ